MFQEEPEMIVIHESEMAEFIQEKLFKEGIVVTKEDILKIFRYENEYLELKGVIEYIDEEE